MNKFPLALLFLLTSICAHAQGSSADASSGGFINGWQARASATQAKQPGWAVPLITTPTGLIQVIRTDVVHQITPTHTDTWNFDNGKGVNIIPRANTELDFGLPPYIQHNSTAKDGFGDVSFLGKYRIACGNEQHGSYTLSAWVSATIPTGSYSNGSTDASIQPNLGAGKGFGRFDVQTTLGATLPTGKQAIDASGRPILWNTAAQYHVGRIFWPEIESNATFFKGGHNDGKVQEFITPALMLGKFALHPGNPKSRPGLAVGLGMQIATSHFHSFNHGLLLSARWIY